VENAPQDAHVPCRIAALRAKFPVVNCARQQSQVLTGSLTCSAQMNMSSSATLSEKEFRILIADDHPVVREGLVAVVDLKAVGQALDEEEACLLHHELRPDILLLDLRMSKKNGQGVASELTSRKPQPELSC
jgi:PleD family two-component response regulator